MKYGIIIRNVTDLRAKPDFRSERKSQLLYNEPVIVESNQNGYSKVNQTDGYNGWVDEKSVFLMSKSAWIKYWKSLNGRISSPTARIISKSDLIGIPTFLFFGTMLLVIQSRSGRTRSGMPNGEIFYIRSGKIERPKSDNIDTPDISRIIRQAKKFIGTPYLWGGVTPFGYDCSGLVQILYRMEGIKLPRDSKDQQNAGIKIDRASIQKGDLLFFKGHVAMAIDSFRIIHSSLGEGGVAINSLNPGDKNYRPDLDKTFICARRLLK